MTFSTFDGSLTPGWTPQQDAAFITGADMKLTPQQRQALARAAFIHAEATGKSVAGTLDAIKADPQLLAGVAAALQSITGEAGCALADELAALIPILTPKPKDEPTQ